LGIGRPSGNQDPADYVLKAFGSSERKELPDFLESASSAVESLMERGLERTQQDFNK
jgi:PTH1 family peptidyl-tRNA hydrolase